MKMDICPNFENCKLVKVDGFVSDSLKLEFYLLMYCKSSDFNWNNCKRYLTKKRWHLCPDFVMPDTMLSVEEIIDKYEEEELND
ncbi:MAG: hypothetical protein ABIJ16_13460 [Bacteroidota bacterium]